MTRKYRIKTDYDSLTLSIAPILFDDVSYVDLEGHVGEPIIYALHDLSADTISRLALAGLRQTLVGITAGISSPHDCEKAMIVRYAKIHNIGFPVPPRRRKARKP